MNILYFIGNGFDLNLGMKTRYSDFYEYYSKKESQNEIIQQLKKNISSEYKNWADLELGIGSYTSNLQSENHFEELFDDLLNNLADYLQEVEDEFDFGIFNSSKIYVDLYRPEGYLLKADNNEITNYKNNWQGQDWNIRIITFNYTRSLEKTLNYNSTNIKLGTHHKNNVFLKGLEHLHGYLDDRMIMGVNDISQINNVDFHVNQNILEAIIKPQCNKVQKHTVDDICRLQITSAHLICIYGSSIGDTDNCWWELIGEQLRRGCKIIIFTKGEEINKRMGYKTARLERGMREYFLNKTKLTPKEKSTLSNNVYIGVNTNIFGNIKYTNDTP